MHTTMLWSSRVCPKTWKTDSFIIHPPSHHNHIRKLTRWLMSHATKPVYILWLLYGTRLNICNQTWTYGIIITPITPKPTTPYIKVEYTSSKLEPQPPNTIRTTTIRKQTPPSLEPLIVFLSPSLLFPLLRLSISPDTLRPDLQLALVALDPLLAALFQPVETSSKAPRAYCSTGRPLSFFVPLSKLATFTFTSLILFVTLRIGILPKWHRSTPTPLRPHTCPIHTSVYPKLNTALWK